ncbi:hypothetical protein NEIRO03_2588 [Nematocida sp. AWRm78]|nr:hypothetical protein NEIRO03_2588 [Nematocida sp. AWRm78]
MGVNEKRVALPKLKERLSERIDEMRKTGKHGLPRKTTTVFLYFTGFFMSIIDFFINLFYIFTSNNTHSVISKVRYLNIIIEETKKIKNELVLEHNTHSVINNDTTTDTDYSTRIDNYTGNTEEGLKLLSNKADTAVNQIFTFSVEYNPNKLNITERRIKPRKKPFKLVYFILSIIMGIIHVVIMVYWIYVIYNVLFNKKYEKFVIDNEITKNSNKYQEVIDNYNVLYGDNKEKAKKIEELYKKTNKEKDK